VHLIKLGDDLELDPRAYELRRAGCLVRLERIPMEILLFLIERRPDLVTRPQIAEKIWGQNTYGDIDNGESAKALEALRQVEDRGRRLNLDPSSLRGLVFLGMGRKEEVIASLHRTCETHPGRLRGLKVDPNSDPLRGDPRFEQMIRCAHLEP
jgi:hypothetical protein